MCPMSRMGQRHCSTNWCAVHVFFTDEEPNLWFLFAIAGPNFLPLLACLHSALHSIELSLSKESNFERLA